MKKILLSFFVLLFNIAAFAQMPNIANVWMNKSQPYNGLIAGRTPLKLKVNVSDQNKKNDQEYFLAGYSLVENSNYTKFEGKLIITKYRDGKKRSSVYGDYEFAEEPGKKHSGIFTGKFIYTFKWNSKSQQIENEYIQFIGDWKSYDGSMSYKTNWNNQPPK